MIPIGCLYRRRQLAVAPRPSRGYRVAAGKIVLQAEIPRPSRRCRRGGSGAAAECGRFSSKGKNGILPASLKRVPVALPGRLDESSGRLEKGSGCSDGVSAVSVESRPLRPSAVFGRGVRPWCPAAVSGDGPAVAANLPPRPSRRPAIANKNQKHFLFLTKFISLPCKGSERGAPPPTD